MICSLLLGLTVQAASLDSLRAERRSEGLVIIHQVEEDETLYGIARRYSSSVQTIITYNKIQDSRIEIGQVIEVLVQSEQTDAKPKVEDQQNVDVHLVEEGQTLYSISKLYDVKVKDLKKWNRLESNAISPGVYIKVAENVTLRQVENVAQATENYTAESSQIATSEANLLEEFEKYLVQTGETLYTIATKIGVSVDSLRFWNGLTSNYLKIGQELLVKGAVPDSVLAIVDVKKNTRTLQDEDGFEKIVEEGIASVIESMDTRRYLALHRSLPIGTELEVRSLMNNQIVHVKVVGRLPNTGLNENLLIRLSQPAYEQLGILDPKSRVEVSYYK